MHTIDPNQSISSLLGLSLARPSNRGPDNEFNDVLSTHIAEYCVYKSVFGTIANSNSEHSISGRHIQITAVECRIGAERSDEWN